MPPDQKRVNVKVVGYPGESDPGPYPVPDNVPIEYPVIRPLAVTSWTLRRTESHGSVDRLAAWLGECRCLPRSRASTEDEHDAVTHPAQKSLDACENRAQINTIESVPMGLQEDAPRQLPSSGYAGGPAPS